MLQLICHWLQSDNKKTQMLPNTLYRHTNHRKIQFNQKWL